SPSAWATQLRIVCAEHSNSFANSCALRPARTSATILRRYSAGYGGLGLRIVNTSCAKDYVSTKPGQLQLESKRYDRALVWFRRDLRAYDHAALYHALKDSRAVYCAFVFDTEILDALPSRADRRVEFIFESIIELRATLEQMGGGLIVRHARARDEIPRLARELHVQSVYANHDYE